MRKHPLIAFFLLAYLLVLVVGEELGWRGYALPLLLEKRSALSQGLFLGGIERATRYWLLSIVYGVAALVVAVFALGLKSLRKPASRSEALSKPGTYD